MFGGALNRTLQSFKFNILAFTIGFIIGMCYIYQKQPPLIEQIVYPTPFNAGKITYNNKNGDCFQYTAEVVNYPEDESLIKQHTIASDTPSKEPSMFDNFKQIFN